MAWPGGEQAKRVRPVGEGTAGTCGTISLCLKACSKKDVMEYGGMESGS